MGQDYSDLYTEKRRFTTYGWEENCAGCRGGGRKVRTRLAWIASFHRGSSVVAWLCRCLAGLLLPCPFDCDRSTRAPKSKIPIRKRENADDPSRNTGECREGKAGAPRITGSVMYG